MDHPTPKPHVNVTDSNHLSSTVIISHQFVQNVKQNGSGAGKKRDVEKMSVLTKWRQSSDLSRESSSGSEKSPYAIRKVRMSSSSQL